MYISERPAEKPSFQNKRVEYSYGTGSIATVYKPWTASERWSARPFALLGGRLCRYRLVRLLRSGHSLWPCWQSRRLFRAADDVRVCAAHSQVRRGERPLPG